VNGTSTYLFVPERGVVAQLDSSGKQTLWERSRLPGVYRPVLPALDRWWALVGRQEP
jgi:hypothetical protein